MEENTMTLDRLVELTCGDAYTENDLRNRLWNLDYDGCAEFRTLAPLSSDLSSMLSRRKRLFSIDGNEGSTTIRICRQS